MLAGLPPDEKQKYSLKNANDYAYLNQVTKHFLDMEQSGNQL